MKPRIAVNLISGALGSGKTTLIRHLVSQKPPEERWALLINEFGVVGIDGAILAPESLADAKVSTHEIPGGCICCTAKGELKQNLVDIAKKIRPDRLIIEPTGLGEPETVVDVLRSIECAPLFDIQTLFSVFDASRITVEDLHDKAIFQSLLNMADIILLNKTDVAKASQVEALEAYCHDHIFPSKRSILKTQNGEVDIAEIYGEHFISEHFRFSLQTESPNNYPLLVKNAAPSIHTLPFEPINIEGVIERAYQKSPHAQSIGWIFDASLVFDWKKVFDLFEQFQHTPAVLRAKGIFRVGNPRMLFQYVSQTATREIIAYRKDSRIELLLTEDAMFDFQAFERALDSAIKFR